MTDAKVLEVLHLYSEKAKLAYYDQSWMSPHEKNQLGHIINMIPQMRKFLAEGKREKVMRWLGFIQGYLWTMGIYSLDDLKAHNRQEQFVHVAFAGPQTKRPYDFTFPLEDAKAIYRELGQAIGKAAQEQQ